MWRHPSPGRFGVSSRHALSRKGMRWAHSMSAARCASPRMLSSKLALVFNCQTASRILRSPDAHHRPSFMSGSGFTGLFLSSLPRGACGTTGRFTAPAAPTSCVMRAARLPFSSAHGRWPSPTPKIVELNRASEADLRLRSARGWILRLAASLTGNCRLRRPRPDRTNCRTGMHLDRPPVASASISCPTADPRLSSVIRRLSGPTSQRPPHPAPQLDDDRVAPSRRNGTGTR